MASRKRVPMEKSRKLVVVGDGMCGKTCLLHAFANHVYIPGYTPTVFDTHATDIQVDGKQEDFDRLRPLSYPDSNAVLLCFSVDSPASAINIIEKWNPEVRYFCGQCPVILVACKKDLRTDRYMIEQLKQQDEVMVTTAVGKQIAAQIKADAYMECSAKTGENVHEVFLLATRLALRKRSRHKKGFNCTLH